MEIGDIVHLDADIEPTGWTIIDMDGEGHLLLKREDSTYATADLSDLA